MVSRINMSKVKPRGDLLTIGTVSSMVLSYLFVYHAEAKWLVAICPIVFIVGYLIGILTEYDFAERGGRKVS